MASVSELKELLETERIRLAEVSEASINAVSSLLSLSQWVLAILAIILALIAIIGWTVIYKAATTQCKKMAATYLENYIKGDDFKALVSDRVEAQVEKEWGNRLVSTILDISDKKNVENSPFPEAKQKGE